MQKPIIQVKGLRKVYSIGKEQVVALDNINLDIGTGDVCCIVGTSGSGKSTLLNQLAGLEKPTRGQVVIAGKNISRFNENQLAKFRQKNIGFVFQSYNLMASMTAIENVSMPLIFRGVGKSKREKASRRILKEVGLQSRSRHKPSQMSGGQQQRVGIARAFVARPKIIFADEPTGNLDTRTTIEVMQMMVRLCKENGMTLILVTHDTEIAQYADRIVTIRDGNITSDVINPNPVAGMTEEEADAAAQAAAGQGLDFIPVEDGPSAGPDPAGQTPLPEAAESPPPAEAEPGIAGQAAVPADTQETELQAPWEADGMQVPDNLPATHPQRGESDE